ncbi:MAG: hypothetical protein AAGA92_07830 [Planctomycetota bacterium]
MAPTSHAEDHAIQETSHNGTNWTSVLLASAATLSIVFFWFVRPAQQHIRQLERTCNRLAETVDQLTVKCVSVERAASVMELIDQQGQHAIQAQQAVSHIDVLRRQIVEQAEQLAHATRSAELSLAAASSASQQSAAIAEHSLSQLDDLQCKLIDAQLRLTGSTPVLARVQGLISRLSDAMPLIAAAEAAAERSATLQQDIVDDQIVVRQAELAADSFAEFCGRVAREAQQADASMARLDRLVDLKEGIIAGTDDLPEASTALAGLLDLRAGVLRAEGTIGRVQHMLVDVMMLRPALDRALEALGPAIQLSRREEVDRFEQSIAAAEAEEASLEAEESEAAVAATPAPAAK